MTRTVILDDFGVFKLVSATPAQHPPHLPEASQPPNLTMVGVLPR